MILDSTKSHGLSQVLHATHAELQGICLTSDAGETGTHTTLKANQTRGTNSREALLHTLMPASTHTQQAYNLQLRLQGTNNFFAGDQLQQGSAPNYLVSIPARLPGPRCFSDASLRPDQTTATERTAGIGILLTITGISPTHFIYIQAKISQVTSVLMAEAAGLALGAELVKRLLLKSMSYLSDSQLLVHFFNSENHSSPPDWRIKPLTCSFINFNRNIDHKVYKINRSLNSTAHILAHQASKALAQSQFFFSLVLTLPTSISVPLRKHSSM